MALDPARMQAAIIANLPHKTGRSLDEWLAVLAADGPEGRAARIAWLKSQGLGHVTAQVVVDRATTGRAIYADAGDELLERLFGVEGQPRRERFERVRRSLIDLVPGTTVTVCKGYVGFSSGRQYAAVRANGDLIEIGVRHAASDGVSYPVRRLGGGAIESAFRTAGDLDEPQRRLVLDAAGVAV